MFKAEGSEELDVIMFVRKKIELLKYKVRNSKRLFAALLFVFVHVVFNKRYL